jgi:GNAT superfamily N-acetyltransferase
MAVVLREIPGRVRRGVQRHGVLGALRAAPYLHEDPIWYRLGLAEPRPHHELPDGMRLRSGRPEDIAGLDDALLRIRRDSARERFAVPGAQLWLVEADGLPRFACWLFHERTPVATAPGAWLELPAGVVCLEDSMASPAIRGRGVAPATWTLLADDLAAQGVESMITKVDASNAPSRRAVEKAGFREILKMTVRRIGPVWRAQATTAPDDPLATLLLERLER